jgi:hypothetical protein
MASGLLNLAIRSRRELDTTRVLGPSLPPPADECGELGRDDDESVLVVLAIGYPGEGKTGDVHGWLLLLHADGLRLRLGRGCRVVLEEDRLTAELVTDSSQVGD